MTEHSQRKDCKHNDKGICKGYCVSSIDDLHSRYVPCYEVLRYMPKCRYECRFMREEIEPFFKQLEVIPDVPRAELTFGEWRFD